MSRKLVVDSSVFIALSRRGTLEQYLKQKKDEGYEVLIPRAIARELLYDPKRLAEEISEKSPVLAKKIMQSVEAIDAAIAHGLIRVETQSFWGDHVNMTHGLRKVVIQNGKP